MSKFTLQIILGNEAMQTPYDVAEALRDLADKIEDCDPDFKDEYGKIMDMNGNSVGTWKVT
jgi:hypothetical protein